MPRRATAKSLTIPPPVMGWNTRDPISTMDQQYAVEMENYFPDAGVVALRKGYRQHATGVGTSTVPTIYPLEYGSVSKLFAVGGSNSKPYDASSAGAASLIDGGVTTFATSRCCVHQFRDRLFIKPVIGAGVCDVYHWTGTGNVTASAFTGPSGDDKDLFVIGSYKNRLYFGQFSAPSIWYGGVDAVTGALTEFPLTSVLRSGHSYIFFCGSIARAKQAVEDDLFCVVTDTGEVLIYSGDNPGSTTWSLIGRYQIPKPVSERAFFYSGADLLVVTQIGVISIGKMISGTYDGQWPLINDTIKSAFVYAFNDSGINTLNDLTSMGLAYPKGGYLSVNYHEGNDVYSQLVMNTVSGSWCKFTGQNAQSWAVWANGLYFGCVSDGKIFKADNGYFDEDPASAGNAKSRTCLLRPAYNYFDDRSTTKQFTQARVILQESEGLSLTVDADVDYADTTPTSTISNTTDTSYKRYTVNAGLSGIGKAASIRFEQSVTTKRRSIEAIEVFWNEGDIS